MWLMSTALDSLDLVLPRKELTNTVATGSISNSIVITEIQQEKKNLKKKKSKKGLMEGHFWFFDSISGYYF